MRAPPLKAGRRTYGSLRPEPDRTDRLTFAAAFAFVISRPSFLRFPIAAFPARRAANLVEERQARRLSWPDRTLHCRPACSLPRLPERAGVRLLCSAKALASRENRRWPLAFCVAPCMKRASRPASSGRILSKTAGVRKDLIAPHRRKRQGSAGSSGSVRHPSGAGSSAEGAGPKGSKLHRRS